MDDVALVLATDINFVMQLADKPQEMKDNAVVGVVNIEGIPANQLRKIRSNLRDNATFIVSKNSLLKLAIKEASKTKKGMDPLLDAVDGQCGVIMTDTDPFKLYQTLDDTKTKAPAKGGELAPEDIIIEEGDTPFKPLIPPKTSSSRLIIFSRERFMETEPKADIYGSSTKIMVFREILFSSFSCQPALSRSSFGTASPSKSS